MKINKKVIYSFGILGVVAAPVATVISCGEIEIDDSNFTWPATLPAKAYAGDNETGYIDPGGIDNFPTNSTLKWSKETTATKTFGTEHNLKNGDKITLEITANSGYALKTAIETHEYTIPDGAFPEKTDINIDMSGYQVPADGLKFTMSTSAGPAFDLLYVKTFLDLNEPADQGKYDHVKVEWAVWRSGEPKPTTFSSEIPSPETAYPEGSHITFQLKADVGYKLSEEPTFFDYGTE